MSASSVEDIAQYFGVEEFPEALLDAVGATAAPDSSDDDAAGGETKSTPRRQNFNVAPTTDVLAVFNPDGTRRLDRFRWGLVPRWAKDLKIGSRMINARAETVAEKNSFKPALKKRRCIISADGFYEWQKLAGTKSKQPMYIHRPDGEPFAFAGLWETWRPKAETPDAGGAGNDGDPAQERPWVHTCTIITTSANEAMAPVHDRMPVMLAPGDWEQWLDPEPEDAENPEFLERLTRLLVPAPNELIAMHPVSTEVNRVVNNGPELIERVELATPDAAPSGAS